MQEKNIIANTYWADNERFADSDTYDAIATFTKTGKFLENKDKYLDEEGDIDMCKAMDDLIKRGEERGEQRGEQRGENRMIKLIQCMVADGATDLIPRIAEEADFCKKMYAKYGIV